MSEIMKRELVYLTECEGKNQSDNYFIDTWAQESRVGRKKVITFIDVVGFQSVLEGNPLTVGDLRDIRAHIDEDIIIRTAIDEVYGEVHFICMSCVTGRGNCYNDENVHRIRVNKNE